MYTTRILKYILFIYFNGLYMLDISKLVNSKIYNRCELANQLNNKFMIPMDELAGWICILFWESGFDTKAYRIGNFDGSKNYGIFQINDLLWCQSTTSKNNTNFCNSSCDKFRDNDISDDVKCAQLIYRMQGFSAWGAYNTKCNRDISAYIKGCDIVSSQTSNININNNLNKTISKNSVLSEMFQMLSKTSMSFPEMFRTENKKKRAIRSLDRIGKQLIRSKRTLGGHDSFNPFEDARVFVFNPLCCYNWKAADVEWSSMKNWLRDVRTTALG